LPIYHYKAATPAGEVVEGTLEGTTREHAVEQLHALGQIPIRLDESAGGKARASRVPRLRGRQRINQEQLTALTRELATLLRAGMPLERGLAILGSLSEGERMGELLDDVRRRIKGGETLAAALEAQEGVFSRLYINLVRAGEAGGALEGVLERLAEHLERSKEMREALTSALIYPMILVFVALLSIFVLLAYVIPQFSELFEGAGAALPLATRITIAAGDGLKNYGWAGGLAIVLCWWLLQRRMATPEGRLRWHRRFLRLPLVGDIITKVEVARFARTLGTLLHNGVPLLKAMAIVKDTIGNQAIADNLERVAASLKEGQRLADPLAELAGFPPFAVQMIRVGEESGRLEEMLMQVANLFDQQTQTGLKRSLALLEPVLILVLGLIIAGVVMSILVAILGINQLVV